MLLSSLQLTPRPTLASFLLLSTLHSHAVTGRDVASDMIMLTQATQAEISAIGISTAEGFSYPDTR